MDSGKLTAEQYEQIHDRAATFQDYLQQITKRMDVLHFPEDDALRAETARAIEAVNAFTAVMLRMRQMALTSAGYDWMGPKPDHRRKQRLQAPTGEQDLRDIF